MSWNVRGLNEEDKRIAIRQTILLEKPDIVNLQETKLRQMNDQLMKQTYGRRLQNYTCLNANGTRGGILIAWNARKFDLVQQISGSYTVSAVLKHNGENFKITAVYGPTNHRTRGEFFAEIQDQQPQNDMPWVVCGDFNVTLLQEDRNNMNSTNWRESTRFSDLLMELELLNLPLKGRNYTWSNARYQPTMARLDRFLISSSWDQTYPNSSQEAVANTSSDHTPLMLLVGTRFKRSVFFRFENAWLNSMKFKNFVRQKWN